MTLYPEESRIEEVTEFLRDRAHTSCSIALEDMEILPETIKEESLRNEIRARLYRGDFSAWFYGVCTVEWMGVKAKAALGRCSFTDFKAFEISLEYEKLRNQALRHLATRLAAIERTLKEQTKSNSSSNETENEINSTSFLALLEI